MAFDFTENFGKFDKRVWISSPTMHGEEMKYVQSAYDTNWMSTVGENINEVERIAAEKCEMKYAVGLCNCTSALHLCIRSAGEKLFGKAEFGKGVLFGQKVFCSDMTFCATLNPVVYEDGTPIFIDTDKNSWNMDPEALEKAFELYPDVKLVVCAELYGFPGQIDKIAEICKKHGAVFIEDAAEAMGATINGKQCGSFGDYSAISYNGNKIITGSSGGCLLTNDKGVADTVRKWSTQSRENALWYQHNDIGYNYRMSNVIAGVIRGQYLYLDEHIAQKKAIYERYKNGLKDLPISMNPIIDGAVPNYWLSALIIDKDAMCEQKRSDNNASFTPETGKSCPTEILDVIFSMNAEGRPIWKPMHLQPIYKDCDFIKLSDDVGADIFERGLCLPSDNKMTPEQQDKIIEAIKACFK